MNSSPWRTSRRMTAVQTPIIPQIGEWTRAYPDTLSLGQGMVHYAPPRQALAAARAFGNHSDDHKYAPVQGLPELLNAIQRKLVADNGISISREYRIVVTAGSNMGFLNALFAITDPGDEVILPLPYYFNQEMAIRMLNCTPVGVSTGPDYQLDPDALREAITPRTRAIVTISPNNPTGAVYSPDSLHAVNSLCRERGLYHISDEAYEYFVYEDARHFSPGSLEQASDHTISLFSLSKAYGFASWRIGYMVIPAHLHAAIEKVQDTNLICVARIAQYAAMGALQVGSSYCLTQLASLAVTRSQVLSALTGLHDYCHVPVTQGAFYLLLKVNSPLSSLTVAERLIREHGVAVIPGNAFGMKNGCYLRIAYGVPPQVALEGVKRLAQGIKTLATPNHR